jgi:hypothetical protein
MWLWWPNGTATDTWIRVLDTSRQILSWMETFLRLEHAHVSFPTVSRLYNDKNNESQSRVVSTRTLDFQIDCRTCYTVVVTPRSVPGAQAIITATHTPASSMVSKRVVRSS